MDHPPNSHQYPNHSRHLNRSHTKTTSSAEPESRTCCFVASWRPLSTLPRWWSPRKISSRCSKTCCCSWWREFALLFSLSLSLRTYYSKMKSASKAVLMCCAFMRETSVRSRVLVGPSLFCEELKDKRDRINFVSCSLERRKFFAWRKKKKKSNHERLSSPPEVRFSLFLRRRSLSVSFFAWWLCTLWWLWTGIEDESSIILVWVLMY